MTINGRSLLLILGLLAGGDALAGTQTMNINIPVRLENISPEVSGLQIDCKVGSSPGSGGAGSKQVVVPLQKDANGVGSLNGVQSIPIEIHDAHVKNAYGYRCDLTFEPMGCYPNHNGTGACAPKEGTTPTMHWVEGSIPKK
jgi:hypothetical protein